MVEGGFWKAMRVESVLCWRGLNSAAVQSSSACHPEDRRKSKNLQLSVINTFLTWTDLKLWCLLGFHQPFKNWRRWSASCSLKPEKPLEESLIVELSSRFSEVWQPCCPENPHPSTPHNQNHKWKHFFFTPLQLENLSWRTSAGEIPWQFQVFIPVLLSSCLCYHKVYLLSRCLWMLKI